MKKGLLIIAALMLNFGIYAQNNVMNKGDFMLNIGLGLGGSGYLSSGYGFLPGFNISGEVGMFPTGDVGIVTLGGIASVKISPYSYYGVSGSNFSTAVLARGAWHLSVWDNEEWDVYAGTGLGVRYSSSKYTYTNSALDYKETDTDFVTTFFVGGRWMMKENFGFFGEMGYDAISSVKMGITLKL